MRRTCLLLAGCLLSGLSLAAAPVEADLIDNLSEILLPYKLFLVNTGPDAPRTSEDGRTRLFEYQAAPGCRGNLCQPVLFSYRPSDKTTCVPVKPDFGDLPVKGWREALFTVPTITDHQSRSRDFLSVYKDGYCYEFSWGFNGKQFKQVVSVAEQLLK